MRAGGIRLARVDPVVGSGIRQARSRVVIPPDDVNVRLRSVIIAPVRTGSRPERCRVALTFRGQRGPVAPDRM